MDTWTLETQKATLRGAIKHGETYTSDELEMIAAFGDEPIAEVARAMGRSYFAISTIKAMIAAGKVAAERPRVPAARVGGSARQFMIGDDEGWD